MRPARFRLAMVMTSGLLLSLALAGGVAAQGPDATEHPIVGTWVVVTGEDAQSDGSDLYVVHADGTVNDVAADGLGGVGSWLPNGDRGAVVTILSPQSDDEGHFVGHRIARGSVDVGEDGATFAGIFTVELVAGADGATTGQIGPLDVTGQRIMVEAPDDIVPPSSATPLTPDRRSRTDCAGQPVVLVHSRSEFWLTGDCPDVRVEGTDIDVYAQDIGTLTVVGNDNDVRAGAVTLATLQGGENELIASSVDELVILGSSNDAKVRGPIGSLVIDGSRNEVEGRPIGTVVSNGRFNDIGRR